MTISGRPPDLEVHADDLGRIGHEAFVLQERLRKAGDVSRGSEGGGATSSAAGELKRHNFSMGEALTTTLHKWESQLSSLRQACGVISDHLDFSASSRAEEDAKLAKSFGGQPATASDILKYFK
ncbi:hypothetical protein [Streptomyces sp. I05A-00742]|uniref:hypothetical protein n=1 Tax=Streptomyces sp. I05A-00742 TaxID=2732853 RepID=UPI001488B070|nr:hypothetical protein [Streptomyces sp. I05A-00742]